MKGQWRNKFGGGLGHDHLDPGTILRQFARQVGCLVGGNASGYAQYYGFIS
jgi:hypothetical protein